MTAAERHMRNANSTAQRTSGPMVHHSDSSKPRALFVTHDTSLYGASRSLQYLLRNYAGAACDMMAQRPLIGSLDDDDIRLRFGDRIERIFNYFLPFDACYQYARTGLYQTLLRQGYNGILRRAHRKHVEMIMRDGAYDFIHLNSLVLHPLISSRHRFIIHMRDVYNGSNPAAVKNVQQAAGVIFIDEATRGPFRDVPLRKSIVLNNPVDMTAVKNHSDYRPAHPNLDVTTQTIFSVIGVVSENKGTEFIVRTFLQHADETARLLIVGGRERSAIDTCRTLSRSDHRIIYWGEEPQIEKIYAISDYILRGESFPCIGRTVYEGLYGGCRVILPGDPSAPPPMFEFDRYRNDIFFYRPRNGTDLLDLFRRLTGKKVMGRDPRSNIGAYVDQFHDFVLSVIAEER